MAARINNKKRLASQKTLSTNQERAIEIACKRLSIHAINVLEMALKKEDVDIRWKIQAAKEILDRGWGRPAQSIKADINISTIDALVSRIRGEGGE